jgi:hypothetical protein
MMIYSRVSFLRSSSLDEELISVTKANISKICSLISIEISLDMRTRSKDLMF